MLMLMILMILPFKFQRNEHRTIGIQATTYKFYSKIDLKSNFRLKNGKSKQLGSYFHHLFVCHLRPLRPWHIERLWKWQEWSKHHWCWTAKCQLANLQHNPPPPAVSVARVSMDGFGDVEFLSLTTPWKLTCPRNKRDYFSSEYIFQTLIFGGYASLGRVSCLKLCHWNGTIIEPLLTEKTIASETKPTFMNKFNFKLTSKNTKSTPVATKQTAGLMHRLKNNLKWINSQSRQLTYIHIHYTCRCFCSQPPPCDGFNLYLFPTNL